jgi:LAS superfamily LD-carboxypeptidase LdcB
VSSNLKELDPRLAPIAQAFVDYLRQQGCHVEVTSTYRSPAKQRKLYARYLRGDTPYSVAPPGNSQHELRRAFDVVVRSPEGAQEAAGRLWESIGGRWGGRFKDPVHFDAGLT